MDLISYFNYLHSYRQNEKQALIRKVPWHMVLDSTSWAGGAAWKVTLRHLCGFEEGGRRYKQIGMHVASMM